MNGYDIALFFHLLALFAAFAATALLGLAMRRVLTARTAGDALHWLGLAKRTGRVFPLALLTLVASGAAMVSERWSWSTSWVDVGLAGVVFLALVGDQVAGRRAAALAHALAADPAVPLPDRVRDPLWWAASNANPGVALGVVFAMVTKPAAAGAAAALIVGGLLGALAAVPLRRAGMPTASLLSND
jgi:hypothetical protein